MTVSTSVIRKNYTGDGITVNFPIPFPFYLSTDILVLLAGATLTSGYSVSGGNGSAGTLTMATAPATGVVVQIILNVPLTQIVNLVDGTSFPSVTLNQVNDRAIQACLRLSDQVSRSLRAPDGDVTPGLMLPSAAARAGLFLGFDGSGNATVLSAGPGTSNTQATLGPIIYPQTQAEANASIVPTTYIYASDPIIDVRRYGWSSSNTASQNATILNTAIAVAAATLGSGCIVQIPAGQFNCGGATDIIDIPANVWVRGAGMRATQLTTSNTGTSGLFRLGGPSTGVVKYGCLLTDMSIILTNTAGKGIYLLETVGAQVDHIYLEGPISASRSTAAVTIDGGNASSYFNCISSVIANHFHYGYELLSTGNQPPTTTNFINCTAFGDVATDITSIGLFVQGGVATTGSGSVWYGGNFENCGVGVQWNNGCASTSLIGARFEGDTVHLNLQNGAAAQSVIGCLVDQTKITDSSTSGAMIARIGCINGSNQFDYHVMCGLTQAIANVTGQTPLQVYGYPGDTATHTFQLLNSANQVLFALTNQGKFARLANAAPVTITGSYASATASVLHQLLSALNGYGLIMDSTTP